MNKENKKYMKSFWKTSEHPVINGKTISTWSVEDTMVCTGLNWLASPVTSFFELPQLRPDI
jgi:hypothetical protein